ncbi:hypothetical protein KS4_09030 [Poriferisphaera corsica]|uniref:Prepilin-type N-terminal cleavage/methylation domain-containing protein n=1 Tax=Poriferisphaera corsica TaxID=2528020 RepID=A0A517YRL6_9BACT|nr:type II secretion system protein [Poriferisphaera corsica]QDU32865.1 hypothetical protein KS4_09030 [Poriferisphaera corsica]
MKTNKDNTKYAMTTLNRSGHGFTLIELLIVISILAVLIGLLMPALRKSRIKAQQVVCMSNLKQIYTVGHSYVVDFDGFWPGSYILGAFSYRQAPGNKTSNDPRALPETFGLPAIFDQQGYMDGHDSTWICPSQVDPFVSYGNTYMFYAHFSVRSNGEIRDLFGKKRFYNVQREELKKGLERQMIVMDNFTLKPGLTGFRGPFRGYTVPYKEQVWPHPSGNEAKKYGSNVLYVTGHVGQKIK